MASVTSSRQPGVVDAASLSLEQLVGIQRDLESEIQNLSTHLRSLRLAKNKLKESQEALHQFCRLDSSNSAGAGSRSRSQEGSEETIGKDGDSSSEKKEQDQQDKKPESSKEKEEQQLEVLVPLTASLYVKGRLTTREKLLVDVGTGYWVEKTGQEASVRLGRTSEKVSEQVTKVERVILEKQRQTEASRTLIQQKYLQEQLLQQQLLQQASGGSSS